MRNRSGEAAGDPISIRLTPEERRALDALAEREGTTPSAIVRRAVRRECGLLERREPQGREQ